MVLDGTWLVHLPKVGWWLVCQANLGYFRYRLYQPEPGNHKICYVRGWEQTSSALIVVSLHLSNLSCGLWHICLLTALVAPRKVGLLLQVGIIVWVLWITYFLSRATRSLQQRPYTAFRCFEHCAKYQALHCPVVWNAATIKL